jgi:putative restriction endonuclease
LLAPEVDLRIVPALAWRPLAARLGQGSFRLLVTDAYNRRCAITQERTLPVLEAAHIRRYSSGGEHSLANGLLLRSDLHRLFDLGYLMVDPDRCEVTVSRRLKEEFENGRGYCALQG